MNGEIFMFSQDLQNYIKTYTFYVLILPAEKLLEIEVDDFGELADLIVTKGTISSVIFDPTILLRLQKYNDNKNIKNIDELLRKQQNTTYAILQIPLISDLQFGKEYLRMLLDNFIVDPHDWFCLIREPTLRDMFKGYTHITNVVEYINSAQKVDEYKTPLQLEFALPKKNIEYVKFLLENLSFPTLIELEKKLEFCCSFSKSRGKIRPDETCELLNYSVSRLAAKDTSSIIADKEVRAKYMAHLCSFKGEKTFTKGRQDIKLEEIRRIDFLGFRIRNLFEILFELRLGQIPVEHIPHCHAVSDSDFDSFRDSISNALKTELLVELQTMHTELALECIRREEDSEVKKSFQVALAKGICDFLYSLKEHSEDLNITKDQIYCFPVTWSYEYELVKSNATITIKKAHAVYVIFMREKDHWIIQIDNLGEGCDAKHINGTPFHHPYEKGSGNVTKRYPYVWRLSLSKERDTLMEYLKDLIAVSTTTIQLKISSAKAEAQAVEAFVRETVNVVYGVKFLPKSNYRQKLVRPIWVWSSKEQTVSNCTVRGHNIGLRQRLNQFLSNLPQDKRIYHWIIRCEKALIDREIISFSGRKNRDWWREEKIQSEGVRQIRVGLPFKFDNTTFVERVECDRINKKLKEEAPIRIAVCQGEHGTGKTQLALRYYYGFNLSAKEYDYRIWCSASTKEDLIQSYKSIAYQLGIELKWNAFSEEIVKAVKTFLENKTKWLLVIDDAIAHSELQPLLPEKGGDILVTTTKDGWTDAITISNMPVGNVEPLIGNVISVYIGKKIKDLATTIEYSARNNSKEKEMIEKITYFAAKLDKISIVLKDFVFTNEVIREESQLDGFWQQFCDGIIRDLNNALTKDINLSEKKKDELTILIREKTTEICKKLKKLAIAFQGYRPLTIAQVSKLIVNLSENSIPDKSHQNIDPFHVIWDLLKHTTLEMATREKISTEQFQQCLSWITYLGPNQIPFNILVTLLKRDENAVRKILNLLSDSALIQWSEDMRMFSVHGLIYVRMQQELQQRMQQEPGSALKDFLYLLEVLTQSLKRDNRTTGPLQQNSQLLPCASKVLKDIEQHKEFIEPTFTLASRVKLAIGVYYSFTGNHVKCIDLVGGLKEEIEKKVIVMSYHTDLELFCEHLARIDEKLPTLYAQVLYHLARGYMLKKDGIKDPEDKEKCKWCLDRAMAIREIIDRRDYNDCFNDSVPRPMDSVIFKRTGKLQFLSRSVTKESLTEAKTGYLDLVEEEEYFKNNKPNLHDYFNLKTCYNELMLVYQRLMKVATHPEERATYYKEALKHAFKALGVDYDLDNFKLILSKLRELAKNDVKIAKDYNNIAFLLLASDRSDHIILARDLFELAKAAGEAQGDAGREPLIDTYYGLTKSSLEMTMRTAQESLQSTIAMHGNVQRFEELFNTYAKEMSRINQVSHTNQSSNLDNILSPAPASTPVFVPDLAPAPVPAQLTSSPLTSVPRLQALDRLRLRVDAVASTQATDASELQRQSKAGKQ